jgi:hypothetical protein
MATRMEKLAILTDSVKLIFENIKFADQKASILLALNSSIAGGAYAVGLIKQKPIQWTATTIVEFVLIACAVAACVWVTVPRPRTYRGGKGLFHPQQILLHASAKDFHDAWVGVSEDDLLLEATALVYEAARIYEAKFRALVVGIWLSIAAWMLLGWLAFQAIVRA